MSSWEIVLPEEEERRCLWLDLQEKGEGVAGREGYEVIFNLKWSWKASLRGERAPRPVGPHTLTPHSESALVTSHQHNTVA